MDAVAGTSRTESPRFLWSAVALVIAAAVGLGFLYWSTVGSKIQGAGSPQGAIEKLLSALASGDQLSLYGSLAPSEIAPLTELVAELQEADHPPAAAEMLFGYQDVLSELEISFTGLEYDLVELADGITRVDITAGEIRIDGDIQAVREKLRAWLNPLLEAFSVSRYGDVDRVASFDEAADLFVDQSWPLHIDVAELSAEFTGIPIVTVEEGGAWHVSPLLTAAELLRIEHESTGNRQPYAYGSIPEPVSSASPQEALDNLLRGIDELATVGNSDALIGALPLPERRVLGLHRSLLQLPPGQEIREARGDIGVLSQTDSLALVELDRLSFIITNNFSNYYLVEVNGHCGALGWNNVYPDTYCLDKNVAEWLGFEHSFDLANAQVAVVKEGDSWHLSVVHTSIQALRVVLDNVDQDFLDQSIAGRQAQHDAYFDYWTEWQLQQLGVNISSLQMFCLAQDIEITVLADGKEVEVSCNGELWAEKTFGYDATFESGEIYDTSTGNFRVAARSFTGTLISYDSATKKFTYS